jgi:hypothetical protein
MTKRSLVMDELADQHHVLSEYYTRVSYLFLVRGEHYLRSMVQSCNAGRRTMKLYYYCKPLLCLAEITMHSMLRRFFRASNGTAISLWKLLKLGFIYRDGGWPTTRGHVSKHVELQ